MRKISRLLLVMLILVLAFQPCISVADALPKDTPRPTPSITLPPTIPPTTPPTPTPTSGQWTSSGKSDHLDYHIGAKYKQDGEWVELKYLLINSYDAGIFSDGILFFSGLDGYVKTLSSKIDELVLDRKTDEEWYRIEYDVSYLDSFSSTMYLYRQAGDNLECIAACEDILSEVKALEPGRYLLETFVYGARGYYYTKGSYLLWIVVT
ncbi:MAG: hypothetical protein IKQ41_12055 [Clostridia bacterium]|nr:hypothetical protein [Clostridia bacterium]